MCKAFSKFQGFFFNLLKTSSVYEGAKKHIFRNSNSEVNTFYRIGLQRFDIVLDEPQHVYYRGKFISGKVYLELQSPTGVLGEY